MKKLLILPLVLALSNCAVLEAYNTRPFDYSEYQLITTIRDSAEVSKNDCGSPVQSKINASAVADQTRLYSVYENGLPNDTDSARAAVALDSIAQELNTRYRTAKSVSKFYCESKFTSIANAAKLIQHVQGTRPR